MPNQRDVAKEADVSSASVSRYITDPKLVSMKIAKRIQKAMVKLNYRVDYSARALRTGKYNNIAIIAPDFGPFYSEVLGAIMRAVSPAGYFTSTIYREQLRKIKGNIMPELETKRVDGVIFFAQASESDDHIIEYLQRLNEPFVIIDRLIEDDSICQIAVDNYGSGRKVAEVFLKDNHKDFLFIWGSTQVASSFERYRGFKDRLSEAGIDLPDNRQIQGNYFSLYTYKYCQENFSDLPPFTAVFASNDSSGVGFIRSAYEHGVVCTRDYGLIGHDNIAEFSPYLVPSLSTFEQPNDVLGTRAAEMILGLINGNQPDKSRIILNSTFIPRESHIRHL
ncbi:MAG: LacI family DNA-binding transcriptional regulator [Spirochaetales bacterium]|nr:LacI family DNA-binding transcriptional regulator [Spirochaetales bacterium]